MTSIETEREHAFRQSDEHRVLAEHYCTKNARRWREHRDKAAAWFEYAAMLPSLYLNIESYGAGNQT